MSKVYAAKYSLRFPRITAIRWDMSYVDANTEQQLNTTVEENKGMIATFKAGRAPGEAITLPEGIMWKKKGGRGKKGVVVRKTVAKGKAGVVPHMLPPDLSGG